MPWLIIEKIVFNLNNFYFVITAVIFIRLGFNAARRLLHILLATVVILYKKRLLLPINFAMMLEDIKPCTACQYKADQEINTCFLH